MRSPDNECFFFFFKVLPQEIDSPKGIWKKEPEEAHIPLVSIIPLKYVQISVPNNSITLLTATANFRVVVFPESILRTIVCILLVFHTWGVCHLCY